MTSDERKTLEALAGDENDLCTTTIEERAAIRSALATIDALTQQVATLTAESADLNAENDMLNARVITGAQQVQDLEARAIPKNACLHLANGVTIEEDEGEFLVWMRDDQRLTEPLPTLSAALRAATEAT